MSSPTVTSSPPDGWIFVSEGDLHVLAHVDEERREALARAAGAGLVAVLEELAPTLSALPSFALADTSGAPTRVLVRGDAYAVSGPDTGRAEGREPWREFDVAGEVVLHAPEPTGPKLGWRMPSRFGSAAVAASPAPASEPIAPAPDPEPDQVDEVEQAELVEPHDEIHEVDQSDDHTDDHCEAGAEVEEHAGVDHDEVDYTDDQPLPTLDDPVGPVPSKLSALADEDAEPSEAPAPEPTPEQAPEPERAATPEPEPAPAPEPEPAPLPPVDLTLPPPKDGDGAPPAARVQPGPAKSTSVIDSVPWRRGGAGAPAPDSAPPPPVYSTPPPSAPVARPEPAEPAEPADPPASTQPDAAQPTPDAGPAPDHSPPPPPPPVAAPVASGGESQADGIPAPGPSASPPPELTTDRGSLLPTTSDAADGPVVLAVLCPAGHASSPHSGSCRVCGRDIPPQQPFQTPRPRLGVLRISTGGVVPLDRGVLLGRSPRVNADLPPNARPHLVRLASVDNDISRNHAEVVLEGWHVLVRDLGSTNGTTVTLPGEGPVRLRPTEDQGIEPGTVISIADEVTLHYEVEE